MTDLPSADLEGSPDTTASALSRGQQNRRAHLAVLFSALSAGLPVASLGLPSGRVHAQLATYPNRPIRLVVPFPAGGATDIIARLLAQRMAASLGQPVVIDNKPGAGGSIGSDLVAKAPPDGYTLLMATSSTHSIGPVLNPKIPYDAVRDFAPVAWVAEARSILLVGASSPARTTRELVTQLKAAPGRFNFGSSGIGTYPHLAGEMFKWRAGNLFVVHIPYRGTGLVIPDLVSGQIAFLMDSIVSSQSHIRDGKVRALAVSGARRSKSLPEIPTFEEIGIGGMQISNWFGLFAPAGTPSTIVEKLDGELAQILRNDEVIERLEKLGAEPRSSTPAQFGSLYQNESRAWQALIQRAGIKPRMNDIKVLAFDVFGTVVDWHGSIAREFDALDLGPNRPALSGSDFALAWRDGYQPAMRRVRSGELGWTRIDDLHRMILDGVLQKYDIQGLDETRKRDLNRVWHRLSAWPDSAAGLARLKRKFVICTLSNGNVSLLTHMAKNAELPWDTILSAEVFQRYKPDPGTYLGVCDLFDLKPAQMMMVAAHKDDLLAAHKLGCRTAFVERPDEFGPRGGADHGPEPWLDYCAGSFLDLADQLGCPG